MTDETVPCPACGDEMKPEKVFCSDCDSLIVSPKMRIRAARERMERLLRDDSGADARVKARGEGMKR